MPDLQKTMSVVAFLLVLTLSGCSSFQTVDPVYSAAMITRDDLLSGQSIFGQRAAMMTLPEDHVMQLDDKMRAYLERYVPRHYVEVTRVTTLMDMMMGPGTLGMEYNMSKTHTAREAFRMAEGNCLAFSYLFAAFARERRLKVSFQEVQIPPEWDYGGDEVYYFSRHVNIRVHMRETRDLIVDIDRINYKPHYRIWKLSENEAIALYYSNKGTDYLAENDIENAFRYLVKGLKLSPRDAALWSNLGVFYRQQGLNNYAEKAYFIALGHDHNQRSVLNNLSVLYSHMGEVEKAEYYFRLARDRQMKNPYYRYQKALEAFEAGDYKQTLEHLTAAVKRRDDVPKFHDLLGDTYARIGDETRAEKSRSKARNLLYSQ